MSQFSDAVSQWSRLDAPQSATLRELFVRRTAAARDAVALPGSADHRVVFVERGLLRFYYPTDDGRPSNKAFVVEGEFAGALASAHLDLPILYGIEALEETEYLTASVADWSALMDRDPAFERLGRKLAERILARKELRTRSLLLQSATERYQDLVASRPDLVQRVPLHHLASYLGVTDVHLSRVRRALAA